MIKKLLIAAPLALAAGALLTAPASAATWSSPGQVRAEIAQLDRQIDRTRGLSNAEHRQLERKVDRLQALYRTYARNGFNRTELSVLDRRVDQLKADLYRQAHDRNGYNGRYDRYDDSRDGRGHR